MTRRLSTGHCDAAKLSADRGLVRAGFAIQPGPFVVEPEELDDGLDVAHAADVVSNPTRLGVQVVKIGFTSGNELFPNANWKREVCQLVPVQVTDLALANVEEDHASTMRLDPHSGPRGHFALNLNPNRLQRHPYYYA